MEPQVTAFNLYTHCLPAAWPGAQLGARTFISVILVFVVIRQGSESQAGAQGDGGSRTSSLLTASQVFVSLPRHPHPHPLAGAPELLSPPWLSQVSSPPSSKMPGAVYWAAIPLLPVEVDASSNVLSRRFHRGPQTLHCPFPGEGNQLPHPPLTTPHPTSAQVSLQLDLLAVDS